MSLNYEAVVRLHNQVSGPARAAALSVRGMADSIRQSTQTITHALDGSVDRIKQVASTAVQAVEVLSVGVLATGASATKTASQFEDMGVSLEVMTGSAENAKKSLQWIRDFNLKTPNELADVTSGFVALKNQGIDPTDGTLKTLVDTAAAFSDKTLNDAVQMMTDAVMGEGERLKEFGIVQRQIAGKQGSSSGPKSLSMVGMAKSGGATQDMVEYLYRDRNGIQQSIKVAKDNQDLIRKTLLKIFDDKFAGLGEKRSKTLSGTLSNLKDAITELQQQFIKGNRDSTDSAGGLYKIIQDSTNAKLDWLTAQAKSGRFADWGKQAAEVYQRINQQLKAAYQNLKPVAQQLAIFIGGWRNLGLLAASGMGLWVISPLLSAIASQLTLAKLAVVGSVLAWRNWQSILPKIAAHFPVLAGNLGVLQHQLGLLKQQGASALSQLWHWLMQNKTGWGQAFGAVIGQLLVLVNHQLELLNQRIRGGNLGQWLDMIWQKAQPAVAAIAEFAIGVWESIRAVVAAVMWVKELVGGWENVGKLVVGLALISYFSSLLQGIGAILGIIGSLAGGIGMIVSAGMAIGGLASAVVVGVLAIAAAGIYLYKNWDKVAESYRRVKPQLAETWWGRAIINIVTLVRKQIEAFRAGLEWCKTTADTIKPVLVAFWEDVKVTWGEFRVWVSSLISDVSSILELGWKKIKTLAGDAANSVVGFFTELPEKMLTVGKNIIDGLWNGLKSSAAAVTEWMANLGSDIINSAKDTLGIKSPSRVFAEIGGYTIEGMQQGMESEQPKLMSYLASFGDKLKGWWQDIAASFKSDGISGGIRKALEGVKGVLPEGIVDAGQAMAEAVGFGKKTKFDALQSALNFAASQNLTGMTAAQTRAYAANVMQTESGGNIGSVNSYGFSGQYQFGADALAEAGLVDMQRLKAARAAAGKAWYKGGQHKAFLANADNWRLQGGQAAFLANKALQDRAFLEYTNRNIQAGLRSGAIHAGDEAASIAAYAKAAHLKGVGGANRLFINGQSSTDAYGTSTAAYANQARAAMQTLAQQVEQQMQANPQSARPIKPIMSTQGAVQKLMTDVRGQHELTLNLKAAPGVNYSIVDKKTNGTASKFNLGKQAGAL